jgi:hypothetical protein
MVLMNDCYQDIGYPGDEEEGGKPGCCLGGFPFAFRSGPGRQAPSAASKSVSAFHRTALKVCGLYSLRPNCVNNYLVRGFSHFSVV